MVVASEAQASDTVVYAPAPAWVKPAPDPDVSGPAAADAPVLLILDQQQRIEDGRVWAYADNAVRIVSNQMLAQAGTVTLPWQPSSGDLIIHRVEILRGAEHIDLLKAGQKFQVLRREQQLERLQLNGVLSATMQVEGLRVGDVLRVSFSMTTRDPAMRGQAQSFLLLPNAEMRTKFARARVSWPAALDLHWKALTPGVTATPVVKDGYNELELPLPLAKAPEIPDDAPARFRPMPLLETATFADWQAVSKTTAPLYATDGLIAPGSPLAAEVAKIAAAEQDPRKRAARALQLVQDKIRYLFKGMDGGNYTPQKPVDTWTLRYGDCKAKTLLLLSILRQLGIEAEPVLASVEMSDQVSVRLPSMGAFDHVLVHAKIDGKDLWLDGTSNGDRLEDLDNTPPFRNVLPVRPEGAALMRLPMHPAARPATVAEFDIDASAGVLFPTPYKARVTFRGPTAELIHAASAQGTKDQINGLVDKMLTAFLGQNEAVDRKIDYDETSATATVTADGVSYSGWNKEDGRYKLQLDKIVSGIDFSPDRARTAWKDIPATSGKPEDGEMRFHIRLPKGGAGFALQGDQTLPPMLGGVLLKRSVTLSGGVLTLDDRSSSGISEIAPADIPAARAQVAQAKTRLLKAMAPTDYPAAYTQVEAAKRAKAFDPILAVYTKAIAADPDKAHGYTVRAWFLESIYDRKGALADLDKVIALEPDVDSYLWRARLHSELGEDPKAIADAEAALALDPSSASAIRQLAGLKAENGKRDEALAMLADQAAQGGKEKPNYVMSQVELMADGGKVDEAATLIDTTIAATPGNAALLNARCWLNGTHNRALATALKDCTKSIELSEGPAGPLDSRAMVYFRMNRFDDALTDLNAALDEQPDLAASLYMRGVIRKLQGDKAGDSDIAAARTISPQIDRDYGRWGIKP